MIDTAVFGWYNEIKIIERSFKMSKNKSVSELLVEVAEENQVRMILDLLNDCKDLDEAKAKVQALLDKEAEA